jgi:thioredoxin reductase (NADPH)
MDELYDVVIIGAGPAGLTAGLYAARARMKTIILEKFSEGGQAMITQEVVNYPGSVENPTGPKIVSRMVEQCDEFGASRVYDEAAKVDFTGKIKTIEASSGNCYKAKSVIIATGSSPKKIGCPGEAEFTGRGVSYCATCDAGFFRDREVFCVGGGDTALQESIYLTKFARKVTLIHRRDAFRAAKSIVEKAEKNPKISYLMDSVILEVYGGDFLQGIKIKNVKTGEVTDVTGSVKDEPVGLFVFVGYAPATSLFGGMVDMNQSGYIITDDKMSTNIPGVFAAGDVREKPLRQIVTATSDGAVAAVSAEKYIEDNFAE